VVEKFEKLTGHVLASLQVATIRDAVLSLEKPPDAGNLTRLLMKQ
jgi:hypothetical protein